MIRFELQQTGDAAQKLGALELGIRKKVLYRIGGYGRVTMRRLFRKRKKPSAPGTPPNRHEWQLRDLTEFEIDEDLTSVVVGPRIFRTSTHRAVPVPKILNEGGDTVAVVRSRKPSAGKDAPMPRTIHIAARPFVVPTLTSTLTQLEKFIDQSRP